MLLLARWLLGAGRGEGVACARVSSCLSIPSVPVHDFFTLSGTFSKVLYADLKAAVHFISSLLFAATTI